MRIITPELNTIRIGHQGENGAVCVQINAADWPTLYGAGEFRLDHQRPSDPAGYPCEVSFDGQVVSWIVTASDVAIAGYGKAELVYKVNDVVAKSITYSTIIEASVDGSGDPPEPWESWVDEVMDARDEAVEAASNAADSERNASASEQAASQSESNAHGSELAAAGSASSAETYALKSEGYAVGKQNGTPVESGSPYYHNNASYYAAYANEKAEEVAQALGPINAHLADHNNPHQVTPSQIGAIEKVAGAVADNIAVLTAAGEVADSGVSMELEETLTGELVSFKALAATPLKALNVALSPLQDLNGYDNPWPGGGGKNKFDKDDETLVYGAYLGGGVVVSNGNNRVAFCPCAPNTTYTVSTRKNAGDVNEFGVAYATTVEKPTGGTAYSDYITASGSAGLWQAVTITTGASATWLIVFLGRAAYVADSLANLQVELGSSRTTWQPYSNICPITGRTEINVYKAGANWCGGKLFADRVENTLSGVTRSGNDVTFAANASTSDYLIPSPVVPYKANTQYTFILTGTNANNRSNLRINYTDNSYDLIPNFSSTKSTQRIVSDAGKTIYALIKVNSGGNTTLYCDECGIFEGNVAADAFVPYTGKVENISLGGTVYGGTVDITDGEGTDTLKSVDLGTLTYYKQGSNNFYALLSDAKTFVAGAMPNIVCSAYPKSVNGAVSKQADGTIFGNSNDKYIVICDSNHSADNTTQFKAAMSGVQLVYELATPNTLTTTPTEITTLKGDNNIWSDGDSLTLTRYKGLAEIVAEIVAELNA